MSTTDFCQNQPNQRTLAMEHPQNLIHRDCKKDCRDSHRNHHHRINNLFCPELKTAHNISRKRCNCKNHNNRNNRHNHSVQKISGKFRLLPCILKILKGSTIVCKQLQKGIRIFTAECDQQHQQEWCKPDCCAYK